MTTLLLADIHGGKLGDGTAKALAAAKGLGAPVHILVAGRNVADAAAACRQRQVRQQRDQRQRGEAVPGEAGVMHRADPEQADSSVAGRVSVRPGAYAPRHRKTMA